MQNRTQKQAIVAKLASQQSGYILVLTVVLLSALLLMSLSFLQRTKDSLQISGYNREASESLVVAESAMNYLYGRFVYNADLDKDGNQDNDERIDLKKLADIPLPYLYYVSSTTNIEQKNPGILQKIANGEARSIGGSVNKHIVDPTTDRLLITNLYTSDSKPLVFEFDGNNHITQSSKTWTEVAGSNNGAAVAWFELVKNEDLAGTIQVYVQAVGKVGTSKSYLQRLIGNYPTTLGQNLGGLNESSL